VQVSPPPHPSACLPPPLPPETRRQPQTNPNQPTQPTNPTTPTAAHPQPQVIPLEQNGQLPPPAKVTQQWKEEAVARSSMAKVGLRVIPFWGVRVCGVGGGWNWFSLARKQG